MQGAYANIGAPNQLICNKMRALTLFCENKNL